MINHGGTAKWKCRIIPAIGKAIYTIVWCVNWIEYPVEIR